MHQDRIDAAGKQTLTCIALDGRVCWNAALDMRIATSFSLLSRGSAEDWALVVTGEANPQAGDKMVDQAGDNMPLLARVNIADGKVTRFRFADVDFAKLAGQLTPYRSRNRTP